ncbi:MAG: helix-turn-helix domain-containing protein [Fusobacteriaceae bacterium]
MSDYYGGLYIRSGEYLAELRKLRKYTLRQLSEKSGVSQGQISDIEHGRNYGSEESLVKILDALGVAKWAKRWYFDRRNYDKNNSKIKKPLPTIGVISELDPFEEIDEKFADKLLAIELKQGGGGYETAHFENDPYGEKQEELLRILKEYEVLKKSIWNEEELRLSDISKDGIEEIKKYIKYIKTRYPRL